MFLHFVLQYVSVNINSYELNDANTILKINLHFSQIRLAALRLRAAGNNHSGCRVKAVQRLDSKQQSPLTDGHF